MANMGKYCKAYMIERFRQYPEWAEKAENARREKKQVDGIEVEAPRELTNKDHLYLQESFVVTDGIYIDENIIFDNVTSEWISFCKNGLQFEIPQYEQPQANSANE